MSGTNDNASRFGTFLGVYTPSVLTILGLIMYLRFGWVLGNLGLPLTMLVVLTASSITFITTRKKPKYMHTHIQTHGIAPHNRELPLRPPKREKMHH